MSLPEGEVSLQDVMGWAQEQSEFLRHPSHRLVLWYLCINAFRHPNNPEGRNVGDVLSAYAPTARICAGTGLSERGVRDSLRALQEDGYIIAELLPGHGKSRIGVFWTEAFDTIRADYRRGIRDLPRGFKRAPKGTPEPVKHADVIPFPNRQGLPV